MKINKIIWVFTVFLVSVTILVSIAGTVSNSSQKNVFAESHEFSISVVQQDSDLPVVDYNAPEPSDPKEREKKRKKGKRYDSKEIVLKRPHPEDIAVGVSNHEPIPPAIPTAQSTLVIIGETRVAKSSLSNDREGIYTEYCIAIQTILKRDGTKILQPGDIITADRAGGYVRYPNGQKLLYKIEGQKLPKQKARYVFFLYNDDLQNPNYKIIAAYELKNGKVEALDNYIGVSQFNGMNEAEFVPIVLSNN